MNVALIVTREDGRNADTFNYESPEEAVLALLTICTPKFLGELKVKHIGRIQKSMRGICPTGIVGSHAVNQSPHDGG